MTRARRGHARSLRRALVGLTTVVLATTGLAFFSTPPAQARATLFTWVGGAESGNHWSNGGNWQGGVAPNGSAAIYIPGGSGSMIYDLNPAAVSITEVSISGTWNVTGSQIQVGTQVTVFPGSNVDFKGGIAGGTLSLDVGTNQALTTAVHISGALDITNRMVIQGWDADTSTTYLDGTAANHADSVTVTRSALVLAKPAGVAAARRVDAIGGTVKWNNNRQLQDQVSSPVAPELSQPMLRAENAAKILMNGHTEVVNVLQIASGSSINLGGGDLTAEEIRTNGYYGGRSDITNGTFRFSPSPRYADYASVNFSDGTDPTDLHLDAKLLGNTPVTVGGSDDQIPILRLGDADEYTGGLNISYGTVCAAVGYGGSVNANGGVYIDERTKTCAATAPATPPSPPRNFAAAPGNQRVTLTWQAPADNGTAPLDGYRLYRNVVGSESSLVGTYGPTATSALDLSVTNGTTYEYTLVAYTAAGDSDPVTASATPQEVQVPPGPPTLTGQAGDGAVRLAWSTPSTPGNMGLTGYTVFRHVDGQDGSNQVYTGTDRAFLDTDVVNGTTYYYTVVPRAGGTFGTSSNQLAITPTADPGLLSVAMEQPSPAYPGRNAVLRLTTTNKSPNAVNGPLTATVMLPASTFGVVSSGGGGWTCAAPRTLGGRSLVTCTNPSSVAGLTAAAPLDITLSVPAGTARASYPVSYSVGAQGRAASSDQPFQLVVDDPKPAHLAVSVGAPQTLGAADPQDVSLLVQNDGVGATIGTLTARLFVPTAVTVDNLRVDSFWSCATGMLGPLKTVTCTSTRSLSGGSQAPPILLAATAPATAAPTTYLLRSTASGSDAIGPLAASGSARTAGPLLPKPDLAVEPSTLDDSTFRLTVENNSAAAVTGTITMPLRLPLSFITVDQVSDLDTWTCKTLGNIVFTCTTVDPVTIAPGDSFDGPLMSASGSIRPGGAAGDKVVTLSGTYAGSAWAQVNTVPKVIKSPSTPVPLPLFAPPPTPTVSTQAKFADSPLYGQHHSSVTYSLQGNPTSAYDDRAAFVLLLPPSLVTDGTAVPSLAGYPAGTPAPSCELRHGTYAGGYTSAVVCLLDRPAPAGSAIYVTVGFTSIAEIGGTVTALTGIVRRPAALTTPTAILDYAWGRVASKGAAALAYTTQTSVNGITFTASAGPPQRVDAGVLGDDGVVTPTNVVLHGSSSVESATPLNFGWVQTAGPKVTWKPPPAGGSGTPPAFPPSYPFAGGTVSQPDVLGKEPTFVSPTVTQHTEFVFELYVTDGRAVVKSVTTVAIDPLADNPPAVSQVLLTNSGGTTLNPSVAPTAGQELQLRYTTTDAEHDPVAVVPHVVRPGELRTTTFTPVPGAPAGQSWFSFRWPDGVSQVVVEAVLTDGKTDAVGNAVASRHSFVVGPDPAPLGIGLPPPTTGIDPGGTLNLTATLTNAVVGPDSTTVTWSQLSGPPSTLTPSGTSVMLRAPPTAKPGDSITVQALARRGTGSSAPVAIAKVTVAVVALPALGLGPVRTTGGALPASVPTGSTTPLTLTVSGGRAPYTYAWSVVSGGGSLTGGTTATPSYNATGTPGLATIAVDVTDASGATSRQVVAVPVGTLPSGTAGAQGCDPGGPLRTVFDAAAGLADSDHVVVRFGALQVDLGTKSSLLGGATTCTTSTFPISGGSATVSGISFTGVTGSINAFGITIGTANVTLPAAWRLTGVLLHDVVFGFTNYAFTGTLTATSVPVVASTGAVTEATSTLTLGADRVTLVSTARLAGAAVSLAGLYCFKGGPACTGPPAGVVGPVPAGAFAIHASVGNLQFLDHTLTGGGDLSLAADGTLTGAVELVWTGSASGDLGINEVRLRWSDVGLRFHAGATLGGRFAASLDGDYLDADDWSADVSGGLNADWTPAPGLTLAKYNAGTGTGTGVDGSVAMKSGQLAWAISLRAGGNWSTGPLSVKGMSITLSKGAVAPAGCRLTAAQQGNLYLDVKGIAEISWGASGGSGGTKVALNVETCVVPDVGWTLTTTAALSGVQIANGLDLTGVTFTAAHRSSPDQTSYVLNATGNAFGVSGAVTLALLSPAVGDASFLADMMVDLDDLGLPVSGEGHLIYASRPVSDLGAVPGLDAGFATHAAPSGPGSGGCSGAIPASPLAGLPVAAGFTALANFKAPGDLCSFMKDKIGVPVSPSLVVSVNLSGTPVITASITTGPTGYQIFATDDGTKLSLKQIRLSISLGGSFGLMADADLSLAKPTATSPTDVAVLQLSAGVTIQLAGVPSITVVLEKTGDAWNDAFGVSGLNLGDLAIQGGIVFSGIPTPSIGFGAQILNMPTSWKNTLGVVSTGGVMEPVQLVLNISLSNPILDITLGKANGQPFMRPLHAISPSIENALSIDYAQLVIAPFGGDVGSFHYTPGFHIGFALDLLDVNVAVKADLDMASGTFGAHANVGAFGWGPVSLDNTTFDLLLSPANGGLTVGLSGGLRVGSIRTTATASVQAKVAGSTPVLKADIDATLGGVNLGPVSLTQLKVFAHTNLSGPAAIASPLGGITFGATATINVLTVPMTVFGSVQLSTYGGITGGDLLVTSGGFSVGPATVGGTGCDTSVLGFLPAGVTVPTNGPCLQVGIHPGSSNPYFISANGSLSVAGLTAKFSGQVDNTGIAMSAKVQVGPGIKVASVSLSGRLWAGPGINGTQTDLNPVTGTYVVVHNGDFRVHGNSSVTLAAFHGSLSFNFGNIGGTQFAIGTANMDALKSTSSPLSFSASLSGNFSHNSSGFRWDMSANGTMYVSGYKVASALVRFTQSSFTASGSLAAGPVTASVGATLFMSDGLRFNFTGAGSINVIGLGIGASISIGNTTGPLVVSASANIDTPVLHVHAGGYFSTSGAICLWGSANVSFGNGNYPDLVNGSASFCTRSMNGLSAGIHANFWVLNTFGMAVHWSDATHFTGIAGINLGYTKVGGVECFGACFGAEAGFGGYIYLGVSSTPTTVFWGGQNRSLGAGITFASAAKLHLRGCLAACFSLDVGFSVSFNPTRFCGSYGGATACLGFNPLKFSVDF